jgi:hypothetical protein
MAKSVYKIIKVNEKLPKDEKIRALSISAAWCPDAKGAKEFTEAVEKAKENGIFVITCNLFQTYGYWTYSLYKDSYSDPDDPNSYTPYKWDSWMNMVANIDNFAPYYENAFS